MIKAVLLVLCLALAVNADIWKFCGGANDHLTINSVKITPDPPQIGQNLTVSASGSLDETVTSGTVVIVLSYSGITLLNNTYDLCTVVQDFSPCPLAAGPSSITVSQQIPSIALPGSYAGQVNVYDQNNQEITCISLAFSLSSPAPKNTKTVKILN